MQEDGSLYYAYSAGWEAYVFLVIPEIFLLVYVTVLAHFKINGENGDKNFTVRLFPLLLGTIAIMVGNVMLFIPGVTFPFHALGGVIMVLCLVYIMYKQYLFQMSYWMTTGAIYTIALIVSMLPMWCIISYQDKNFLFGSFTAQAKQWFIVFSVVQSVWAMAVILFARRQAEYMLQRKQRHMLREQKQFQDETASLFSREELYKKLLAVINEILPDSDVFVFLKKEKEDNFVYADAQPGEAAALSSEEQQAVIGIANSPYLDTHPEIGILKYDGQRQGFIYVRMSGKTKINYQEADFIRQIAVCTAICLKNIRAYEAVYRMSIHDELLGFTIEIMQGASL